MPEIENSGYKLGKKRKIFAKELENALDTFRKRLLGYYCGSTPLLSFVARKTKPLLRLSEQLSFANLARWNYNR